MRAFQLDHTVAGPDELRIAVLPDLPPQPDRYVVRVRAAAINFFDLLQIQGRHQQRPAFPWVAGNEFAGEVVHTPGNEKDPRFPPGSPVFGAGLGAFATHIAVPGAALRAVPRGWSFVAASALFYTAPTAYAALVLRARARAGDYVLVHGAGGGVGLAAVALGRALGMHVIASGDTQKKRDIARHFGAEFVVDSTADWPAQTRACTPGGRGVDVVLDPVGAIGPSLGCIRWDGRLVVIGFAAGAIEAVPTNRLLLKNVSVSGLFWGAYADHDPAAVAAVWDQLLALLDQGRLVPLHYTERVFRGLAAVPAAMRLLQSGTAWGKVVVDVGEEEEGEGGEEGTSSGYLGEGKL